MKKLTIVIATYNRAPYLLRTLKSLTNQTLDPERFEILVVNNNSTDDTKEVFVRFATLYPTLSLRMVDEMQQGISYVRNRGITEAAGEYIVFLDDDEEANPEFSEKYFYFFENNKEKNAAGGAVIPVYEAPVPKWFSHYIEKMITGVFDMGARVVPFRGKSYPGVGNSGFRKTLFERYGTFDPALGRSGTNPLGGEEKDFFMRLRAAGERYYFVPGAQIYHITPAYKLTEDYFNRLSRMIGVSERIRTRTQGLSAYAKRLFAEAIKWGGTLVLAFGFLLRMQPIKGKYLIRMRRNITCGLLTGK